MQHFYGARCWNCQPQTRFFNSLETLSHFSTGPWGSIWAWHLSSFLRPWLPRNLERRSLRYWTSHIWIRHKTQFFCRQQPHYRQVSIRRMALHCETSQLFWSPSCLLSLDCYQWMTSALSDYSDWEFLLLLWSTSSQKLFDPWSLLYC